MKLSKVILSMLLVVFSYSIEAQKLAAVGPAMKGSLLVTKDTFKSISGAYFKGDYRGMQKQLTDAFASPTFVDDNGKVLATPPHKFDFEKNYYSFIFTAKDPNADKPQLVRVLVTPTPANKTGISTIEFGNATVPGISRLYDVFITLDEDASVGSTFSYVEVENPLHTQLIAAAKLVNFGDIASSLRTAARKAQGRPEQAVVPAMEDIYFAVSEITIPATRSNITAKSTMNPGDTLVLKVQESSTDALEDVRLHHGLVSPCAVAIANEANTLIQGLAASTKPIDEATRKALGADVRRKIKNTYVVAPCQDELKPSSDSVAPLRAQAIQATIDRFLAIADGSDPKLVQNETVYSNSPLNRFSLGVIAGGMFNPSGDDRAKLSDDGKVLADPLSGAISIAALYIHPSKYFGATSSPSPAERFRFLIGYVATPEPGLAAGVGVLLFRGLTINVGYAAMLVDKPAKDVNIGDTPTVTEPLKRGVGRTVFAGFGYNF